MTNRNHHSYNDPTDPLNAVTLRDNADVFVKPVGDTICVTIFRIDRDRNSKLYTPTPASAARIERLTSWYYWPTAAELTPNGWLGYSSR